jgi:hypothetical protein
MENGGILPKYAGGTTLQWMEQYGRAQATSQRAQERGRDVLFSVVVVLLVYGAMSLAVMERPSARVASAILSYFSL